MIDKSTDRVRRWREKNAERFRQQQREAYYRRVGKPIPVLDATGVTGNVGKITSPVTVSEPEVPKEVLVGGKPCKMNDKMAAFLSKMTQNHPDKTQGGDSEPQDDNITPYVLPPPWFFKSSVDVKTRWISKNWPELVKNKSEDEINEAVTERLDEIKTQGWDKT